MSWPPDNPGSEAPSGPAGGDLSGNYPDPNVAKIQGIPVSTTDPTTGQLLIFDGTNWVPTDSPSGTNAKPYWARSVAMPEIVGATGLPGSADFDTTTVLGAVIVEHTQPFNCIGLDIDNSTGNICVALYDDDGASNKPLTRLATSGSVACPASGPAAVPFTSEITLLPGLYWITALASDHAATAFFCNNSVFTKNPFITQLRAHATATFPLPATLAGTGFDASPNFYWNLGYV